MYSVLPTPFADNGDVDEASLRRVVELFITAGVNGVTALGVTGEVARLDDVERARVLEIVVDQVAGRIGVVAGTSAEGTRRCIQYSRHAKAAGATAVMVSPPRMPKLNSEAVVRHFVALAEAVNVEIVVQDYPPISGYTMEPSLLARVAREIPRARTIKLEDPPTPFKTSRILEQAAGLEVRIFGGLGGVFRSVRSASDQDPTSWLRRDFGVTVMAPLFSRSRYGPPRSTAHPPGEARRSARDA